MLQSLEAVATKQRKTQGGGSANKKTIVSTEATDPFEAIGNRHQSSLDQTDRLGRHQGMLDPRSGTLSISSCISKNTGSNSQVTRERLAILH